MPLGAMTAAPALAWFTACVTSRSTVSSFFTVAPSGGSGPQWPWLVYSQKHRSVMPAIGIFCPVDLAEQPADDVVRVERGRAERRPSCPRSIDAEDEVRLNPSSARSASQSAATSTDI